jgi:hypothetical protein
MGTVVNTACTVASEVAKGSVVKTECTVASEVLTEVATERYIFCHITVQSAERQPMFPRNISLQSSGLIICQARSQHESGSKHSYFPGWLVQLLPKPEDGGDMFLRNADFQLLHGVIS